MGTGTVVKMAFWGLLIIILGIALVELGLRFGLGFGYPPLYETDPEIGYLLKPNQRLRRFGNRIEINQYSMRAGAILPQLPPQRLRVLLLGDSIVNGNWWTDQAQTLSALLEQSLAANLPASFNSVEVLNASANSWGPRNQQAYLQRFGTFDAQILVLVLNTDDLFGTQPTSVQVGRDRNYPNKSFGWAISELLNRYFKKYPPIPELKAIQNEKGDRVGLNLAAVNQIQNQITTTGGQLILALTPLKREVLAPGPKDYEIKARERVTDFANTNQIPYVDFLTPFQTSADPIGLYRDHIHLSPVGNEYVRDTLSIAIREQLHNPK